MLPVVGGVPVEGPIELEHDLHVEIGGARLTAQYLEDPDQRRAARPTRAPAHRDLDGDRPMSAAHRHRRPRGAWHSAAIAIGVVALASGTAFWIAPRHLGPTAVPPETRLENARDLVASGEPDAALAELGAIPAAQLPPALAAEVAALRAEIEQRARDRERAAHDRLGDAWKREHLDAFEQSHLHGAPAPGAIRFYLERLAYFAERWPEHREIEWVRRMQQRYAPMASLERPPAIADLDFAVRFHTRAEAQDWAAALAAMGDFLRTAPASEHAAAARLRDEVLAERQAWFDAKLAEARAQDVLGNDGQAVAWLLRIAVHSGEAEMADRAAQELVVREDLAGYLRGYRRQSPEEFAVLAAQPRIADYLRANPLE
jgi:hypothetical protein